MPDSTTDADSASGGSREPAPPVAVAFAERGPEGLAQVAGPIVAFFGQGGDGPDLDPAASAIDAATGGQIRRALAGATPALGDTIQLLAPSGLQAPSVTLICRGDGETPLDAPALRRLGGAAAAALIGRALGAATRADVELRVDALAIAAEGLPAERVAAEVALGFALRSYRYEPFKSKPAKTAVATLVVAPVGAEGAAAYAPLAALADGVRLTRDLVNEPANTLTPKAFADRARALADPAIPGLTVEVMGEAELEEIGMRTLLAVGRGSVNDSYVATMIWRGADDPSAPPVCLVGKGVCFDTGGISLKPAAGMEEMTMDMGGAGVVVGAMAALAKRRAKANVVGVIGLVENMPDGAAQRPGDIVTSLSGKTVEVINTDAEGRLVLADILWRVQQVYKPRLIVDLATLTGAMIVALGHDKAGFFANDEALASQLAAAAEAEGEGLWRLPLGEAYDKQLKSRIADMKNVGGRAAGSITAAQFLQRFVKPGQPWAHIDIAGVTLGKESGPTWPKGPTGWGVATLVRLAEEAFETAADAR